MAVPWIMVISDFYVNLTTLRAFYVLCFRINGGFIDNVLMSPRQFNTALPLALCLWLCLWLVYGLCHGYDVGSFTLSLQTTSHAMGHALGMGHAMTTNIASCPGTTEVCGVSSVDFDISVQGVDPTIKKK